MDKGNINKNNKLTNTNVIDNAKKCYYGSWIEILLKIIIGGDSPFKAVRSQKNKPEIGNIHRIIKFFSFFLFIFNISR